MRFRPQNIVDVNSGFDERSDEYIFSSTNRGGI